MLMEYSTAALRTMPGQRQSGHGHRRPVALVLFVMLGVSSCSASGSTRQAQTGRKMLQTASAPAVTASTSTPVSVNSPDPQVQATTGPANEKLQALASLLAAAKAAKEAKAAPAQAPPTTIVVPAPQTAAVPTTITGPLNLATSTPVRVASPVNVTTPVQQKSFQKGHHQWPIDLNTLINGANLLANLAGAAGSIAGAVPGYINLGKGWPLPLPLLQDLLTTPLGATTLGDILGGLGSLLPGGLTGGRPLGPLAATAGPAAKSGLAVGGATAAATGSIGGGGGGTSAKPAESGVSKLATASKTKTP